jgi:hypothetical protein
MSRPGSAFAVALLAALFLTPGAADAAKTPTPGPVCDHQPVANTTAPPGAVVIDPAVPGDLYRRTQEAPPGTTFWLPPGTHTLAADPFGQVIPKDGDTYLGAPGAVLDGQRINLAAFTQQAKDVVIRGLTVQNFVAPQDQGVVNHDSGEHWTIENTTVQHNGGAGMMAGARQVVRHSCLRDNGQYGMNAYRSDNAITGLVVEGNEIVGNNTDDWETRSPGCGCSGGIKFWVVNRADIRGNWIHDNRGAGLWADTNNNDFLIEYNLIEDNDSEALFYEISYNLVFRDNVVRRNAIVAGKRKADRGDNFPVASVYLSEAGGDARVPARTHLVDIYDNTFEDNWSPTGRRARPPASPPPRSTTTAAGRPSSSRCTTTRSGSTPVTSAAPAGSAAGWPCCRTTAPTRPGRRTTAPSCRTRSPTTRTTTGSATPTTARGPSSPATRPAR